MADMTRVVPVLSPFPLWLLLHERFASEEKLAKVKAPLLFIHGTDDGYCPYWMGRRLYEIAPGPKAFLTIPKGTHGDALDVAPEAYQMALRQFLRR